MATQNSKRASARSQNSRLLKQAGMKRPYQSRHISRTGAYGFDKLTKLAIIIEAARAATVVVYTALRQYHADIDLDAATTLQRCVSDPLANVLEQLEASGKGEA